MGQQLEGDLTAVIRLIHKIETALCTTINPDGSLHTRPLQTLEARDEGVLSFFTDWHSAKVAELERDGRVALSYADRGMRTYVAIGGKARLIKDAEHAQRIWSVEQRAYYPEGPGDSRLAILEVTIERAEYWIASHAISYLVAAVRAVVTGTPAAVIGEHVKAR
jgi:general stress protein 26